MYDFTTGFETIAERRDALVASARRGKASAHAALVEMTAEGISFSIFAVNTPVARQEWHYMALHNGRAIRGLGIQRKAWASAIAWIESLDRDVFYGLFDDKTGRTMAESIADEKHGVFGLGVVKAVYACGCLGFTHSPCYDRHMARRLGVGEKIETWAQWDAVYDAHPHMQTTVQQWGGFQGVPDYEGHTIWFEYMLSGITPWDDPDYSIDGKVLAKAHAAECKGIKAMTKAARQAAANVEKLAA